MSVARISIRQPASALPISLRIMASEYGSCPVEVAAHQMRMRREFARADIRAGRIVVRK